MGLDKIKNKKEKDLDQEAPDQKKDFEKMIQLLDRIDPDNKMDSKEWLKFLDKIDPDNKMDFDEMMQVLDEIDPDQKMDYKELMKLLDEKYSSNEGFCGWFGQILSWLGILLYLMDLNSHRQTPSWVFYMFIIGIICVLYNMFFSKK